MLQIERMNLMRKPVMQAFSSNGATDDSEFRPVTLPLTKFCFSSQIDLNKILSPQTTVVTENHLHHFLFQF